MSTDTDNMRKDERLSDSRRIEFFVDADIVRAESVDKSLTGLRMNTKVPIQVSMRVYKDNDNSVDYQATLCWAGREDDGSMSYGLEFVDEPDW